MGWTRTDDLDQSPARQATFGLEGVAYVLDLCEANVTRMHAALKMFLEVAIPYGDMPVPPEFPVGAQVPLVVTPVAAPTTDPVADEVDPRLGKYHEPVGPPVQASVRAWARAQGFGVSAKGRIPDAIITQYTEAHAR